MEWSSDPDLIALIRAELFTAVVGDVLDDCGYRHQFLPRELRPVHADLMLVGRAMPVLEADVYDDNEPYGLVFAAVDDLKPGEIYLATGASPEYALWGELLTTAAVARGGTGAILNGSLRDTRGVRAFTNFPVFCTGFCGQDQKGRGRVIDYRVPVEVGQVRIEPGDMLIGDDDGVVTVPAALEVEVFTRALKKARSEKVIKQALEHGMLASDAFRQYGIM